MLVLSLWFSALLAGLDGLILAAFAQMKRSVIFVVVEILEIAAVALGGLYHYARKLSGDQDVISRQQREIVQVERTDARQRCSSIAAAVAIPIAVPLAGNPSRQEWAAFEQVQRDRGKQLHCTMPAPSYVTASPGT